MSVNTEAEFKKAPKQAVRYTSKRYNWEGNSMRVTTWEKGGKSNVVTNGRTDSIFYVFKGHLRRTENNQVFELKAGDLIKEVKGHSGFWEPMEPSAYLATDLPLIVAGAPTKAAAR